MNVCIGTFQSAMLVKGGPLTQILQTRDHLIRLGTRVSLFSSWEEFPRSQIDLVHLFGANIGTFHLAREIHKLGVPMVVSPIFFSRHSVPFLRVAVGANGLLGGIARGVWTDYGLLREICSWAAAILPNTSREAELLARGLGVDEGKITVVPNGVDERFLHGDPALFSQRYGVSNFVLNVGHIGPGRKNVLRLVKALSKVNVPAVIIGRIEQNNYAQECLKEARCNPHMLILDAVPNESELLASAYAACDVFTLPSLFETPGIAALEAGLAGAKIVITRHGGTDEYFGPYAEYVEPTSVEFIRHGLVSALNKPKTSYLRDRIAREYLWERVAEKTLAVYQLVLNNNRRIPPS